MIDVSSLATIGFLVFLEGILSIDNALVLAIMVRKLPELQRKRALVYGIWGAFLFRFVALFFLSSIMQYPWIKLAGGAYLLWIAIKHFVVSAPTSFTAKSTGSSFSFWRTVVAVELMDIAFSVDSILAAVSLSQNYWIVMTGGILGILMMRFAATSFIWLLKIFPKLETTAYQLVAVIGTKLFIQGFDLPWIDFHSASNPAAWIFWISMLTVTCLGLRRKGRSQVYAQG